MLECSAIMQRCFTSYNSVVLFFMLVYKIIMLCVMLVCHILILFCTDMFFVTTMTLWYSAAQRFNTNASQSSHLPTFTTDTIHAAIWYNVDDPKCFLHSWHKQHRHFLVLTLHQAQHVSNDTSHPSHLPVYTPDTIYACLQFQRRWPNAFPTAVYSLPSHRTYNLVNIRGDQIITS